MSELIYRSSFVYNCKHICVKPSECQGNVYNQNLKTKKKEEEQKQKDVSHIPEIYLVTPEYQQSQQRILVIKPSRQ